MYLLTVTETEAGGWAVLDTTGRQVWASPFLQTACQRAAADLAEAARWSPNVSPAVRRANAARARAWAQIDARGRD